MAKNNVDRAVQFASFQALRGYEQLIESQKKIIMPKRIMSEDDLQELSNIVITIKKGMIVKVRYYQNDGYIQKEGCVTRIDFNYRIIEVIKDKIPFDEIDMIEIINIKNENI